MGETSSLSGRVYGMDRRSKEATAVRQDSVTEEAAETDKARQEERRGLRTHLPHAFQICGPEVFVFNICLKSHRGISWTALWGQRQRCFLTHFVPSRRQHQSGPPQTFTLRFLFFLFLFFFVCLLSLLCLPVPFSQVCLHFSKRTPSCSTWKTDSPDRSFRRSSSSESLWLPVWCSSQSSISHTQVCSHTGWNVLNWKVFWYF